jgi:uncharacterized protein (TIGR03435 family)
MKNILSALTILSLFTSSAGVLTLFAQSDGSTVRPDTPRAAFEVVEIKQVGPNQTIQTPDGIFSVGATVKPCSYSRDRVTCQLSLQALIEEAFQLKDFEIAGPSWLSDGAYLVQATVPLDTDKNTARRMLQSALVDDFELRFHHEKRDLSVYELIPGRHGVRLQPADDSAHRKLLDVATPAGHGALMSMAPGQFSAVSISLDFLAIQLKNFAGLDLPVVNKTGLTGEYKVDLHWTPTENPYSLSTGKDPGFKDAVQYELGLQLKKSVAPIDVMVIDQVERVPTEN